MPDNWHPKPGDRVFRPRRIKRFRLRKVLGIPAVFSTGYGNVGSSIYYALGIVALVAMGSTPVALGTSRKNEILANMEVMSLIQPRK